MKKITPFLWFDNNAEEAIEFYKTVFKDIQVLSKNAFGGTIEILGQDLMYINGGPMFKFTEAISLYISCETQKEVDYYWDALSKGGKTSQCGWLKDKFGLSWQVVPTVLGELLGSKEPGKAKKVADAMMKMTKLDIAVLEEAGK